MLSGNLNAEKEIKKMWEVAGEGQKYKILGTLKKKYGMAED